MDYNPSLSRLFVRWLQENETKTYQRQLTIKPCLLESFNGYVKRRMEEDCLNAVVLFNEIKAQYYARKITMPRHSMSPIRPAIILHATVRYKTPEGQQEQVEVERHIQAPINFRYGDLGLFAYVVCGVYFILCRCCPCRARTKGKAESDVKLYG